MTNCGFCSKVRSKVKVAATTILQKTFLNVNLKSKGLPNYFNNSVSGIKSGKIKK